MLNPFGYKVKLLKEVEGLCLFNDKGLPEPNVHFVTPMRFEHFIDFTALLVLLL